MTYCVNPPIEILSCAKRLRKLVNNPKRVIPSDIQGVYHGFDAKSHYGFLSKDRAVGNILAWQVQALTGSQFAKAQVIKHLHDEGWIVGPPQSYPVDLPNGNGAQTRCYCIRLKRQSS
jgi:hypothetical protein